MKFQELFDDKYGSKLKNNIQKIDEYCLKFDILPEDFFSFYEKQKGDFTGSEFFDKFLEYFHFFMEIYIRRLILEDKKTGIDTFGWFEIEDDYIQLSFEGRKEFYLLLQLNFEIKKELITDKIFNYFINKLEELEDFEFFTNQEKRKLKLEIIKENDTTTNKI